MNEPVTVKSNGPALHKRQYVGPEYDKGLYIPGWPRALRPKEMTDEEAKRIIEIYPPAIEWWSKS